MRWGRGRRQSSVSSLGSSSWQECSEEEDGYSSEEAENEEDEDDTEEAEEDDDEEMMVPGMEGKEEVCGNVCGKSFRGRINEKGEGVHCHL